MKIDKPTQAQLNQHIGTLNQLREAYDEAVAKFNSAITEALADLENARTPLQEAIESANAFIEETAADLRSEHDDRSEKWQESEAGAAAEEMVSAWEAGAIDPIEDLPVIDELDTSNLVVTEGLEELPTETE